MRRLGLGRDDRRALGVLLAIPLVVFVVPALVGHPIVNGDNQIQNLPLRALAGEDLRHGHMPLWNPYIWSGSPLLGGLNAGALYPFTWLFAVLPVVAAWTINLIVVYITAAIGMYTFLRQQKLRPFSCGFAAASFAFAGSMSAQIIHIGIVQGVSWIPWMLLVEQRLARQILDRAGAAPAGDGAPSVARRVALLGLLGGLVLLTGEPRGMADAAVVVGLAALWHLVTGHAPWRARAAYMVSFVAATAVAAAVGAVQLVPGWSFISTSQRAQETVAFFGSGSLPVRWSILMLVPDLMGGAGVLHQPAFFSHYNLPEVTGYVGLLPLVAAAGLLARSFGRWRHPWAHRWTVWLVLAVVGFVLTYGEYTPLGPYAARVPFYGDLRLQSRNIVIADLALCVLLAYWLDISLRRRTPARQRLLRFVTVAPALAVVVLCLVALTWSVPLELWLGVPAGAASQGRALAPWLWAGLAVATTVAVIVSGARHLAPRTRVAAVGTLIAVDLLLFTVTSGSIWTVSTPTGGLPTSQSALPVPAGTRFAVFDPGNEYLPQLSSLGQNDLNTLVHLQSVEGYGSLTDSGYQNATGTRTHNTLSPCALADGVFVPLGLSTLVTVADDLVQQVGRAPTPVAVAPDPSCHTVSPPASSRRVWFFGRSLSVAGASVSFPSTTPAPGTLRIGVLTARGSTAWTRATVTATGNGLHVALATPAVGFGLVLAGPGADRATDATSVITVARSRYVMDGQLQTALRDASFRFTGYRQGLAVFGTAVRRGPVSLVADGSPSGAVTVGSPVLGTATRVGTTPWGEETDAVTARGPVTLVRSVAFAAGWRAVVRDKASGRTRQAPVIRVGQVAGVRLSAGSYTVTWTYGPGSVTAGLLATGAGTMVVAGAGVSWLGRRRRRRQGRPVSSTAMPYGSSASSGAGTQE
jgi:hypothetical protein